MLDLAGRASRGNLGKDISQYAIAEVTTNSKETGSEVVGKLSINTKKPFIYAISFDKNASYLEFSIREVACGRL